MQIRFLKQSQGTGNASCVWREKLEDYRPGRVTLEFFPVCTGYLQFLCLKMYYLASAFCIHVTSLLRDSIIARAVVT